MTRSSADTFPGRVQPQLKHLFSGLRRHVRRFRDDFNDTKHLVTGGPFVPPSLHRPSLSRELEAESLPDITDLPHENYALLAQELIPSLLCSYPLLNPHDISISGEYPIADGGYAHIWEATHDGRKVVLKDYRCYLSFDVTRVVARFCNEVRACSLLPSDDVFLVGLYSTETHPFGLVYKYMDNLDLKQYLRSEPKVQRLHLLATLAQRLNRMHNLGIVHGHLRTTNVLVDNDGIPYIAGIGNVCILPRSTSSTMEGAGGDEHFGDSSQDLTSQPISPNEIDAPTKADNMYAFGLMAYEVLTGGPVFSGMTEIAVTHLMLKGSRPPRPDNREVSNAVWHMIQSCWDPAVPRRMQVEEVVTILKAELIRISSTGI